MLYSQTELVDIAYIRQWLSYFFPPDETKSKSDENRLDARIKLFGDLWNSIQRQSEKEGL